jgi:hypothetical protein
VAADLSAVTLHPQHHLLPADSRRPGVHQRPDAHQTQDGTRTEQQLETDDALLAAYRDHFGIVLSRIPDDPAA